MREPLDRGGAPWERKDQATKREPEDLRLCRAIAKKQLEGAWAWRERVGLLSRGVARVFHCEGSGPLRNLAIDKFGPHFWVYVRDGTTNKWIRDVVAEFLASKGCRSAVVTPYAGAALAPEHLVGTPPWQPVVVREDRVRLVVQFRSGSNSGVLLDQAPVRAWLAAHSDERSVLHAFSYTGTLSAAALAGGARSVVGIDTVIENGAWCRVNWRLNGASARCRFVAGDVFTRLPQLRRSKRFYDCVILDPPSRGTGDVAMAPRLTELHALALGVLAPGGILVTAFHSAALDRQQMAGALGRACRLARVSLAELTTIEQPETFATPFNRPGLRYAKGWILRRV